MRNNECKEDYCLECNLCPNLLKILNKKYISYDELQFVYKCRQIRKIYCKGTDVVSFEYQILTVYSFHDDEFEIYIKSKELFKEV